MYETKKLPILEKMSASEEVANSRETGFGRAKAAKSKTTLAKLL
jgi:hypothetical protein